MTTYTAFPAVVCGLAGNHGLEEKDPLLELPTLEADDDLTTPTVVVRLGSSDRAPPISPPHAERGPLLPLTGLKNGQRYLKQ